MQKTTAIALDYAQSQGHNMKTLPRTAWVHERRPIHCKRCGYKPTYSLSIDNSRFCPRCGGLAIDYRDLDEYVDEDTSDEE